MKKVIVFALAIALAGTAALAELPSARNGSGPEGIRGPGYINLRGESDVLVYQCREGNTGFGDLIPIYEAALTMAGATVSTVDAPSGGGAFPVPYDPEAYPVTVVLTTENWWPPNFPPNDEATVTAYLNAGGTLYFSGQDYLYAAGYADGPAYGFPATMGAGSIVNDTPFGADPMDVMGGDVFTGWSATLDPNTIFLANPFYPDTVEPGAGAATLWTQTFPENHNGAVIYDAGTYRVIFTTLELAGADSAWFTAVMIDSYQWLRYGMIDTAKMSFGELKASYR